MRQNRIHCNRFKKECVSLGLRKKSFTLSKYLNSTVSTMQISLFIGTMLSLIIGLIDPMGTQYLWRLPFDIMPHSYSIHTSTNVYTQTDFTFYSDNTIRVTPLFDDISAITMHATNDVVALGRSGMPRRLYDRAMFTPLACHIPYVMYEQ